MPPTAKTALKAGLLLALGLGLAHCGKPAGKTTAADTAASASYPYDVAVTFTPAAVLALQKAGVGAVVDATYFGAPTAEAKDKVNDAGEIELGWDVTEIEAKTQTLSFTGKGIVVASMKAIQGEPSVEVRAYSGTTKPNLLTCNTFRDTVKAAQAAPVAITCDAKNK
jgi:hypothetical protein